MLCSVLVTYTIENIKTMMSLAVVITIGLLVIGQATAIQYKNVQCDSIGNKYAICETRMKGNPKVVSVTVLKKDSRSPCRLDVDYGSQGAYIWVNNGCRALFNVAACKRSTTLDCASRRSAFNTCRVPGASMVNHVILKSQRSNAACEFASSFGATQRSIWVNKGCRGEFLACY